MYISIIIFHHTWPNAILAEGTCVRGLKMVPLHNE